MNAYEFCNDFAQAMKKTEQVLKDMRPIRSVWNGEVGFGKLNGVWHLLYDSVEPKKLLDCSLLTRIEACPQILALPDLIVQSKNQAFSEMDQMTSMLNEFNNTVPELYKNKENDNAKNV